MDKTTEDQIHKLMDDKVVSLPFVYWIKKQEDEVRCEILFRIAELTLGTGIAWKLFKFIFKKEIEDLCNNVSRITKESLTKLINKFRKAAHKEEFK